MAKPREVIQKVNFWAMMQNVIIASLSKGQLLPVLLFFLLLVLILRMPAQDVKGFFDSVITGLVNMSLGGYVMFLGSLGGWFIHSRFQRRFYESELKRLAPERDSRQSPQLPGLIESSKPKQLKGGKS
ncbi:MAG: hypothetical protein ABIZ95_18920 [Pyrinomonadaceae bacterium]